MKTKIFVALLIVFALAVLGACKMEEEEEEEPSRSSAPPATTYVGHNNYSIIDGPAIGKNTASNADLRKGLTTTLVNSNQYLSIDRSFATRGDDSIIDGLYFHWILVVTNNTQNNAFCEVSVNTVKFKDSDDEPITSTVSSGLVIGSIGLVNSKSLKSCLGPGESGYVMKKVTGISTGIFEEVNQVEIDSITYKYASVINPNVTILPRSYSYDSSNDVAIVVVKNMNEDPGYFWAGLSYFIFLDADNLPVFWSKLNQFAMVPYSLNKEESVAINSEELDFSGSVQKVKILIAFGVDAWDSAWNIK